MYEMKSYICVFTSKGGIFFYFAYVMSINEYVSERVLNKENKRKNCACFKINLSKNKQNTKAHSENKKRSIFNTTTNSQLLNYFGEC